MTMKKFAWLLLTGIILLVGMSKLVGLVDAQPSTENASASQTASKSSQIRHVVLFRFKPETAEGRIRQIENAFAKLPDQIDSIVDFEWGTNVSPEGLADGFTHCFLVTFRDAAGRDAYLPHAAHKAFVDLALPHVDKVLVVDYAPHGR
jgi:hypothetical protein